MFIVGGAFVNLDKIVAKRLGSSTIGFNVTGEKDKDSANTYQKSQLLAKAEPEDFIQFGMIPEFIGRFNNIANFNELTVDDLKIILTEPKNAVIKQYTAMFGMEDIKLRFTDEALDAIAKKAINAGTGARALRMILESLMRELMFEAPSDPTMDEIIFDKDSVTDGAPPKITRNREFIA